MEPYRFRLEDRAAMRPDDQRAYDWVAPAVGETIGEDDIRRILYACGEAGAGFRSCAGVVAALTGRSYVDFLNDAQGSPGDFSGWDDPRIAEFKRKIDEAGYAAWARKMDEPRDVPTRPRRHSLWRSLAQRVERCTNDTDLLERVLIARYRLAVAEREREMAAGFPLLRRVRNAQLHSLFELLDRTPAEAPQQLDLLLKCAHQGALDLLGHPVEQNDHQAEAELRSRLMRSMMQGMLETKRKQQEGLIVVQELVRLGLMEDLPVVAGALDVRTVRDAILVFRRDFVWGSLVTRCDFGKSVVDLYHDLFDKAGRLILNGQSYDLIIGSYSGMHWQRLEPDDIEQCVETCREIVSRVCAGLTSLPAC